MKQKELMNLLNVFSEQVVAKGKKKRKGGGVNGHGWQGCKRYSE